MADQDDLLLIEMPFEVIDDHIEIGGVKILFTEEKTISRT